MRDRCATCHGAHWIDPVGNRDPQDAEDCPECVATSPEACGECGRSSEITEPTGLWSPRWLCRKCAADRAAEVAEGLAS